MDESNLTKKEIYDLKRGSENQKLGFSQKTKLIKRTLIWSSFFAVIVLAVFGLSKIAGRQAENNPQGAIIDSILASDWTKGNTEAKAILIEYGDFQCPACKAYHPLVEKLFDEHSDIFQFAYRHFPLQQHTNAKPAAYASEAAGKQGKFWEMYDLIFQNQDKWESNRNAENIFMEYANSLSLNIDQFKNDVNSKETKDAVDEDYKSGLANRVNATPTFFLNGERVQPRSYEELENMVKKAASVL